ncbi:prohibitin family protein [Limnofasciculus baicalensis]|uniref:Prohibitin family protein n=1 Tax=Limnofasciculus baicalensis BBK-W-15 TaxID=2699891 RepID=A0AAE3GRI4_9CYAN|nr:prohibitin family protein [Limnofasciculus baicalensis]MCP2728528.1 prohibitin family protein [Limnofasciculus baicalensis BBK-W-15]
MTTRIQSNHLPAIQFQYIIGGIITLLSLTIISKAFTIINPGERGVVMHFGKVQDVILDEGIHPIIPIMTSVKKLNVRVQKTDIESAAGTKDLQIITAAVALNWHIDPSQVNKIYQRLGDEKQIINTIIIPAMTEVLKAATPKKTAEQILKERDNLKTEIDNNIKSRLAKYGLQVDDTSLVNIGFSSEFTKAIEAKQIAEQQALQASYVADKAKQDAEAQVNRAKGEAEAQKLVRETITPQLLQKQAIEKWNGEFPQVMSGNGALPFINISPSNLTAQQKSNP